MPSSKVRGGLYWSEHTKTWHYEFRFLGKKRNGDTGISTSRELAEQWKQKLKERITAEEVNLELPAPSVTLGSILADWMQAEKGSLSQKHIDDREEILTLHFKDDLQQPVGALTTDRMDVIRGAYLAGTWRGKGWGKKTPGRPRTKSGWNRVLRQVKALLRWAKERGKIKRIPFSSRPIKAQKTSKPIVWPEDIPTFLRHLYAVVDSQHVRSQCLMMLQLGLREDEARTARWEWVIARQNLYRPEQTKDRDLREIAFPPGLLAYLREHHGNAKRGLIFPQRGGDAPHVAAYTSEAVKLAGEAMGIKGLTPHRLRATFATTHWEAGTDLNRIQEMMGHEDRATTMTYIVQRPRGHEQDQTRVAKLMGLRSGPPKVPKKRKKST